MTSFDVVKQFNEVQLVDVQLYSVAFQSRKNPLRLSPDLQPKWRVEYDVEYRLAQPTELYMKLKGHLVYEEESPKPFDLTVELMGIYKSEQPIVPEEVSSLVQTHSAPLLWPYLRELIADITTRAGGPKYVLPTLSITFPKRADQNVEGETPAAPEGVVEGEPGAGQGASAVAPDSEKPHRRSSRKSRSSSGTH